MDNTLTYQVSDKDKVLKELESGVDKIIKDVTCDLYSGNRAIQDSVIPRLDSLNQVKKLIEELKDSK